MPQCLPESLRTRLPVTLTPVERMNPVCEHRDRKCLKSCPSHLAGYWEPVVPPRVADGKAAVIFGQIACIKEVAIEAVTCSGRLDTLTYIHAPSDDACAVRRPTSLWASSGSAIIRQSELMMPATGARLSRTAWRIAPMRGFPSFGSRANS